MRHNWNPYPITRVQILILEIIFKFYTSAVAAKSTVLWLWMTKEQETIDMKFPAVGLIQTEVKLRKLKWIFLCGNVSCTFRTNWWFSSQHTCHRLFTLFHWVELFPRWRRLRMYVPLFDLRFVSKILLFFAGYIWILSRFRVPPFWFWCAVNPILKRHNITKKSLRIVKQDKKLCSCQKYT